MFSDCILFDYTQIVFYKLKYKCIKLQYNNFNEWLSIGEFYMSPFLFYISMLCFMSKM